jgi:hypothetical protein
MSDFKKKYLKYKNKYLKTKIMMYGGSRFFRNINGIKIVRYGNGNFLCDVEFIDISKGIEPKIKINFSRTDPEGSYNILDNTYYDEKYSLTKLELLQMKEQARKIAYPQIQHLFDPNELKKFYEREPEIDKELANEERKEKEEEQQKIRREQYEREGPERMRKLEEERMRKLEEERMRKLEEERIRKEEERIRKEAEENRRKIHKIMKSLEKKILSKNIDLAINQYRNIEQSLNEDEKKLIKKVFYYYITEDRYNIEKVELLLNLNIINGQKIIDWYINSKFLIPLDILELLLSRSNENLEFPRLFFKSQFYIIKKKYISDEKKETLSNNLKILLDKYNINYN